MGLRVYTERLIFERQSNTPCKGPGICFDKHYSAHALPGDLAEMQVLVP